MRPGNNHQRPRLLKPRPALLFVVLLVAGWCKAQAQTAGFNFTLNPVTVSGWTNLHGDPSISTITGSASGITISSVSPTNWAAYSGASAFDSLGESNGTFFPAAVMYSNWYQYSVLAEYNAAVPQFIISGLSPDTVYTLKMTASNTTGFNTNPVRYTVIGATVAGYQDVNTTDNTALGATFYNVSPTGSGTINVYVNTLPTTELADISGIQIIEGRTVLPTPQVRITSPANNDILAEDGNIRINATASETGGSIAKVEFYNGGVKLGESTTAPYSYTWVDPDEGHYTINAVAVDALGDSATASIQISVESLSGFWSTTGNIAMNPDSNFVGNVDSVRLAFRTKNIERLSISPAGDVGIGTIFPTAQLHVAGGGRLAGLTADSTKTRFLVSDSSGNLYYRISLADALTGQGIGASGSAVNLGDGASGGGGHPFARNRYEFLNGYRYSIGGTVNDVVNRPVFQLYNNGDLSAGATMDRSVVPGHQTGFRYTSKLGALQLGASDQLDTSGSPIVYAIWPGANLLLNSNAPNTLNPRIINSVLAADSSIIDTGLYIDQDLMGLKGSHVVSTVGEMFENRIFGSNITIAGEMDQNALIGNGHVLGDLLTVSLVSGNHHTSGAAGAGVLIGGSNNQFGSVSQLASGQYLINKYFFAAMFGNANVDFTSLGWSGRSGSITNNLPLFVVANSSAADGSVRSDAITTLFNGRTQINTTGFNHTLAESDVTPKAALEVVSHNTGVLLPKLTSTQRTAIASGDLQNGLLLYNSDSSAFQFYNGTIWSGLANQAMVGMGWNATGNAGTSQSTNFIGTTDAEALVFRTNDTTRMCILSNGVVGIGAAVDHSDSALLAVNGFAYSTKVRVMPTGWSDYVFDKKYRLLSLDSVERYILSNRHLPGVPSAREVAEKRLDIGEGQAVLLKKIEEITLYMIDMHKRGGLRQKALDDIEAKDRILDRQEREVELLTEKLSKLTANK